MNLLKSEWIKVTTTKSAYWLYGIGIALALGIAVLLGQLEQSSGGEPVAGAPGGGSSPLFAITGVSAFTVLLVWIAAIVAVTGEYRYHTIRPSLLVTPSRWPVLVAKTVLFVVMSMVVVLVAVVVSEVDNVAVLIENSYVKAETLKLSYHYLEGLRNAGLRNGLALNDSLVGLLTSHQVIGLDGQDLLKRISCAVSLQSPNLHLTETLAAELSLTAQRLLCYQ